VTRLLRRLNAVDEEHIELALAALCFFVGAYLTVNIALMHP
jgi:hypothetical protein